MKKLTKVEEEIMQVLWQLKAATVKEVIAYLPKPKPAYNTVSTIIRILETKTFVTHEPKGRGYIYFPILKKEEYSNQKLNLLVDGYFEGSFKSMVSFFIKKNKMNLSELDSILKLINDNKAEK